MNIIQGYIRNLGNSRPVFRLFVRDHRVNRSLLQQYKPTAIPGDPISQMVCTSYQETFRSGRFEKNERDMVRHCVDDLQRVFRDFIESYGGYKNARQSGIYRFMSRGSYDMIDERIDGLVMLYRYAVSAGVLHKASLPGTDLQKKHIDNVLAILEAMRAKYEKD